MHIFTSFILAYLNTGMPSVLCLAVLLCLLPDRKLHGRVAARLFPLLLSTFLVSPFLAAVLRLIAAPPPLPWLCRALALPCTRLPLIVLIMKNHHPHCWTSLEELEADQMFHSSNFSTKSFHTG